MNEGARALECGRVTWRGAGADLDAVHDRVSFNIVLWNLKSMLDFVDIYIANLSRKTYSYQLARKNLKYYKSLFKTR